MLTKIQSQVDGTNHEVNEQNLQKKVAEDLSSKLHHLKAEIFYQTK